MSEVKQTFAQVRIQVHFSLVDLAQSAGVGTVVVYHMLLSKPVKRCEAEMVLTALSTMTGEQYALNTVAVALADE